MIKYGLDYNPIRLYYDEIISKKVTVSVKVKRVYQKLVQDLDDEMSEWEYDPKRANHAIEFVENFCKHSKGKMGGKPGCFRQVNHAHQRVQRFQPEELVILVY